MPGSAGISVDDHAALTTSTVAVAWQSRCCSLTSMEEATGSEGARLGNTPSIALIEAMIEDHVTVQFSGILKNRCITRLF